MTSIKCVSLKLYSLTEVTTTFSTLQCVSYHSIGPQIVTIIGRWREFDLPVSLPRFDCLGFPTTVRPFRPCYHSVGPPSPLGSPMYRYQRFSLPSFMGWRREGGREVRGDPRRRTDSGRFGSGRVDLRSSGPYTSDVPIRFVIFHSLPRSPCPGPVVS